MKLKSDDEIIQWMMRWAAMMVSRYVVGKDGRTSCEMQSTSSHVRGESLVQADPREQKERKDKIESEWHERLWLGQSRSTNETIVGTAEGVVRACATRRQDADERWKGDLIKKLQGTPARRGQLMIPIRVRFDPPKGGRARPDDAALEGTSNETHEDHRDHAPEVRVHGGLRGLPG